jgi:hypothetical protein
MIINISGDNTSVREIVERLDPIFAKTFRAANCDHCALLHRYAYELFCSLDDDGNFHIDSAKGVTLKGSETYRDIFKGK